MFLDGCLVEGLGVNRMKKVKVVLVGIGGYGGAYVEDILRNPDELIELVGVVDPYPERCVLINELREKGISIYYDMDSFYKEQSADLAVISTPIFLHAEHILKALENRSNVLCEKPLCSDENDIEKLRVAQMKSGKFVYVGYQWAFSSAITTLKKDILEGKFGKLIEMKSLVLRPRTREYFGRGVGWAGKIKAADGRFIYDSIANNSAAHYLFNMLYIMGKEGKAAEPSEVSAELMRINDIENFDACRIFVTFPGGGEGCFIAAHPVDKEVEPIFEYRFENGSVYYSVQDIDKTYNLLPENYTEVGDIVAVMNDGSRKNYGDPMANGCAKMHIAAKAVREENYGEGCCGIEATSVHTRLINYIQKNYSIKNIAPELLREKDNLVYGEGLFEKALECYKNIYNAFEI